MALGADHAGYPLKEDLKVWLHTRGYETVDLGTRSSESVDYPDFAAAVALAIISGKAARGVLVCGTGIGMAMAANKVPGVRAAACTDSYTARMSREHNDANVLALGARITARDAAIEILDTWLSVPFAGGRHVRRVEKLADLERVRSSAAERADAKAR
ncbi:MAG: ribose 5-phosphate isomerase B [Candidatus Rokubacteria bacterium RIFCSPLOWO2_12_FULL_73_47]|nr:MAG: ribose 5-phosphate isomerase B [Candidatus Rokubacteria bacterium RIFCSPLOWO2_12_FULL_73_47]